MSEVIDAIGRARLLPVIRTAERALDAGAAFLASATARGPAKLFPAHAGGIAYLRSLLPLLPGARIVPTGGIKLADVGAWLQAGGFAVGIGSDLTAADDVQAALGALR